MSPWIQALLCIAILATLVAGFCMGWLFRGDRDAKQFVKSMSQEDYDAEFEKILQSIDMPDRISVHGPPGSVIIPKVNCPLSPKCKIRVPHSHTEALIKRMKES